MAAVDLFLLGIVILPYAFVAGGFGLAIRTTCLTNTPTRPLVLYPLISSFLVTCAFLIWGHYSILTSRSSTAAVGHLFLPFYAIAAAIAAFIISWSLVYLVWLVIERLDRRSIKITSCATAIVPLLVLSVTAFGVSAHIVRQRLLGAAASTSADPDSLESVLTRAISRHDVEVLAKLAKNPAVPVEDLVRIYDSCKSNITNYNAIEYDVFLSLASNYQTPSAILAALAGCPQTSVRVQVGTNAGTPIQTLRQLAKDGENLVRTWVTANPNIPKDLLLELADDPDDIVRSYADSNLRYRGFR